ncbi:hypothetical protein BGZ92_009102 [Podila epicladia]|nr:hypothetical protein BGZ92_009102 [Podila epicladia]
MDAPLPDAEAPTEVLGVWTTAEIVYMSIAGVLLLMALAEIVAFTGSLTYSFIKVHQKAKAARRRGVQYMSLVILVVFWVLRLIFLAAMMSLVPIPHWQGISNKEENHQFIPEPIMVYSQYLAFVLSASADDESHEYQRATGRDSHDEYFSKGKEEEDTTEMF